MCVFHIQACSIYPPAWSRTPQVHSDRDKCTNMITQEYGRLVWSMNSVLDLEKFETHIHTHIHTYIQSYIHTYVV
jgi:hypothetical protein